MITFGYILNCINVPYYASRRGKEVDHLGSRQIDGVSWQVYKVTGEGTFKVRCENSNFNNICEYYLGK